MIDPDAALVRDAGAGKAQAAEALVRRHLPRMLALARRMLNDAVEAEDVAQDLFLRVWRQAPHWRQGAAKFETWMRRVALNLCYDRLRRGRERVDANAGLELADGAPSPSQAWLERQRAEMVRAALARLPVRQQAAIALVHFQEVSNIEAAAALEVSVDALESLLARARRTLKAALAGAAHDLLGDADGVTRV